jgi:hypothetical protein
MRKLFTLAMLVLISTTVAAGGNESKNSGNLTVEGKFLEKKGVSYEVYEIDETGSQMILKNWGISNFSIDLKLHKSYIIKFTSHKGDVKYLNVESCSTEGVFLVNVDFKSSRSAKLVRGEYGWYKVVPLDNDEAKSLALNTSEE